MESALRELDAQQATEVQAAREEQQSAAQYSDRAPLIPFQANLPRQRPRTPSYEQVMARPPLPSYDEVVGMTADEEEAEHGPSRSGLANPYSLEQLRDISATVQMQPERPTVITDVLYKTGSYIALALEPHLALHHRDDWVRDWATDVGHQLGFDDAPEPDTVKQGTHAAPRNWKLRLRGRKPQGLTFGISSNAKYGVSQYAWASGAEWLISRIQAQTTAVRPPSPPPEDEDAQPPAYAPRQEFVDQVCADLAWQVPERAVLSASADTCRYSTPVLTQTCLLTSSGSTRNGSCSEATETADDRDLKIRQGAPSPRPMHTLNPVSDEQASIAKTESSANHPAKPCARWERPPRHSAEIRSVMARAARLLWTSRVSPPSSAAVPDAHRNASIHCHCYRRASLPDPSSMPNRLACLVPFRPLLLLLDQSDHNPTPTQSAHNLAQLVPPDQWAALHVRAHTRAHTHPHWKRDQILRCGDVHPNPGPTSLALINVTALRAHHHEVLDLQEDIVALTETRLTQGAQNAMAFMARQKGWQPFWGAPLLSKTSGIWGAAPGGAALLVREKWAAKQAQRDPGCTLSEELWNSGRWLHVIVTPADGKRPLNVIVVYGIPGDHKLNGKLWEAVLTQVAKLGNSPFLIATDANVQLDHYRCMPNLMMTELLSGRIVDVDLLHARTTGQDCQCSYHNGSIKQKPTRIDGILADAKTASAIMKVLPTERCPMPGHKPVTFTFNFKQSWIEETWTTSPGKVYQWIKEDKYTPTVLIQKEDGTLTGNVPEMDLVIHQKWDPIMRQHADPTLPEPETEPFWRKFGKYVEHHQMECQPITAERLCRQFKDMKRGRATGLDGWTVVDMRNMPWPLLHMLAQLLNWVESHGVWPEQLATGYIPLIPNGEGSEPLQLRPLSVLSAIYGAWSGIRLRDCLIWQEKWVHRNAFAFRPQKSALDAATLLAALIEQAHLLKQALSGAGTDYVKCFDLIPQQISFRMAREFGLDPKPQAALEAIYQQLHRAFKINGALGSFFHATNGVLQGCAMSVLMINMLTTVWTRAVDELEGAISVTVHSLPPIPPKLEEPKETQT